MLEVSNLNISFETLLGEVEAVRDVSFSVNKGEVVGIVGESGSGKTVTSLSIMGLLDRKIARIKSGSIEFEGTDLLSLSEQELCEFRGSKISMIFQEPDSALNPVVNIEKQLREVLVLHKIEDPKGYHARLVEMLQKLNIPDAEDVLKRYPFELSGGMKQRIMIAMALLCEPDLLIADEPTTALDVTTQAEILELLQLIKDRTNTAIILITHDLSVIAEMANRVIVMYRGMIVEDSDVTNFFKNAKHPYSIDLLNTRPEAFNGRFNSISGTIPNGLEKVTCCPYYGRCSVSDEQCAQRMPQFVSLKSGRVRCLKFESEANING